MKINGKKILYVDVVHRPELWPIIEAEIERLKEEVLLCKANEARLKDNYRPAGAPCCGNCFFATPDPWRCDHGVLVEGENLRRSRDPSCERTINHLPISPLCICNLYEPNIPNPPHKYQPRTDRHCQQLLQEKK